MTSPAQEMAARLFTAAAETGFSGVIRVDGPSATDKANTADGKTAARAFGLADRANRIPNTTDTRFGVASVTKGITAAVIGALIDAGTLDWDTPARQLLGGDLPEIDGAVTVAQLLAHTSGIGDYVDESGDGEATDYVLTVPTHTLDNPGAYLAALAGHPRVSAPGAEFAYNNSGYCVLAIIAERATGESFYDLAQRLVFAPAGMSDSGFPRGDEPAPSLAIGYLHDDGPRTNLLHLPVRGSGDGGLATTAGDLSRFWAALLSGRIVTPATLERLTAPLNTIDDDGEQYGMGFFIDDGEIILKGQDAGVSARTWHNPATGLTVSVISNTTEGVWELLDAA